MRKLIVLTLAALSVASLALARPAPPMGVERIEATRAECNEAA